MKNKITTIFILIQSLILAQPILNFTDINFTSSVNRYTTNPLLFSTGGNGASQTWDYSNLVLTTITPSQATVEATAPFISTFSTSNLIVKNTTGSNNLYIYFLLSNSKLELLGISNSTNIIVDYSPNPLTQFDFPFTFNTTISDSYSTINDPTQNNPFTIKYDAYGTLITPFGTFNNVFRTKKLDGIFPEYNWYEQNSNKALLSVIFGSTGINSVTFYQHNTLNITKFEINEIKIYPNPAKNLIQVSYEQNQNEVLSYNVNDILGRKVLSGQAENNAIINITELIQGEYVLEFKNIDGYATRKKFIKL